jgi:integrase
MGCFFRRHSGIYYGVFQHRGKRVWRSLDTLDEAEARRAYSVVAREFTTWDKLTISGMGHEMQALLAGKLAPATLKLYRESFSSFARILGDRRVRQINSYHVESYLAKRLEEVSPSKVNIDYGCLKAAFNRAITYKMADVNPFVGVRKMRIPEQVPQFLTPKEFERLIGVINDPMLRSIVIVAVCTAMRLNELLNLHWQDVDLSRGLIHLTNRDGFRTKSRRNREVPLNQKARGVISGLRREAEFVFSARSGGRLNSDSVSKRFKRCARKAGLPEWVHFHSMRHTGASWLIQSNVPLAYVKEILGHSSVTTTMIYSHAATDHLRESLLRLDTYLGN